MAVRNLFGLTGLVAIVAGDGSALSAPMAAALTELGATVVTADGATPERTVAETLAEHGRIDVLVNNAGIAAGPSEQDGVPDAKLDDAVAAPLAWLHAVAPVLIERGAGRIVNVASVAGPAEAMTSSVYRTAKGAIVALTRDVACRWAKHGVTVNVLVPGWFRAEDDESDPRWDLLVPVPLRRFGSADDIKGATALLASPASAYLTGQVVAVDGGMSAW